MNAEMMKGFPTDRPELLQVLDALRKWRRSMAAVALAWLRFRSVPVIPILGARKVEQLKDNLLSLELALTSAQIAALDQASAIRMGFPHEFYAMPMVRALVFGGMRDKILA